MGCPFQTRTTFLVCASTPSPGGLDAVNAEMTLLLASFLAAEADGLKSISTKLPSASVTLALRIGLPRPLSSAIFLTAARWFRHAVVAPSVKRAGLLPQPDVTTAHRTEAATSAKGDCIGCRIVGPREPLVNHAVVRSS